MASPRLIALFFAFAMAAAALQPSEAARLQVQQAFKPVAAGQEAAEKVADQAAHPRHLRRARASPLVTILEVYYRITEKHK